MRQPLLDCLLALALLAVAPIDQASAGTGVKVRLVSPDARVDVSGTAILNGQNLSGHLTGDGIDFDLTGLVKYRSVSVNLIGRIVPACGLVRQSMNGAGQNENKATSIEMTFPCLGHSWGYNGGGLTYQFRLDLDLPTHPVYTPPPDAGQNASLE